MNRVRGDWIPGEYATRVETTAGWRFDLTPAGRAEFDRRVAADDNPIGLVRLKWPGLYRKFVKKLGHQAVFDTGWIGLWRALVRYSDGGYTLNTIAQYATRSELLRMVRKADSARWVGPSGDFTWSIIESEALWSSAGEAGRPGLAAERAETATTVRAAVKRLKPAYRDIVLSLLDGMTVAEIAAGMKCSPQNVRVKLDKAKRELRANGKLAEHYLGA